MKFLSLLHWNFPTIFLRSYRIWFHYRHLVVNFIKMKLSFIFSPKTQFQWQNIQSLTLTRTSNGYRPLNNIFIKWNCKGSLAVSFQSINAFIKNTFMRALPYWICYYQNLPAWIRQENIQSSTDDDSINIQCSVFRRFIISSPQAFAIIIFPSNSVLTMRAIRWKKNRSLMKFVFLLLLVVVVVLCINFASASCTK